MNARNLNLGEEIFSSLRITRLCYADEWLWTQKKKNRQRSAKGDVLQNLKRKEARLLAMIVLLLM